MKLINTNQASEMMRSLAWSLLESSFPLAEQRTLEEHIRALTDPAFHADIIVEDEHFVGILFYWIYDESYRFVEHFALSPELRGQGIGGRTLKFLLGNGFVTILEIDLPEDEIAIRRESFYKKAGFHTNPYHHIHPSYRPHTEPHELKVMSYPRAISQAEFDRFQDYSFNHILTYSTRIFNL